MNDCLDNLELIFSIIVGILFLCSETLALYNRNTEGCKCIIELIMRLFSSCCCRISSDGIAPSDIKKQELSDIL